jgi:hypothetical protein
MIFLYHKIWSHQRTLPTLGFFEALKLVFSEADCCDPENAEDRVVSKIEIVQRDKNAVKHLRLATSEIYYNDGDDNADEYQDEMQEEGSMYNSVDVITDDKNDQGPYRIETPRQNNKWLTWNKQQALDKSQEMVRTQDYGTSTSGHIVADHGHVRHDHGSHSNYGAERGLVFSIESRGIVSILGSIELLGSSLSFDVPQQEQDKKK